MSDPLPIRDFSAELAEYLEGVISGEIVVSRVVRFAVERHLRDLEKIDDPEFPFFYEQRHANIVLTIMSELEVPDGLYAGRKMEPFDFQVFILSMLFGWREKELIEVDGEEHNKRRFREAFLSMARGNTKTPIAAIIAIQQLVFDIPYFPGAECYFTATKYDQAARPFRLAAKLLAKTDLAVDEFKRSLVYDPTFSFLRPLEATAKSSDSMIPQLIVKDEVHAWRETDRDYKAKLETGLGKRPQPLSVTTTTAGDDDSTLWQEEDDYARRVVDPSDSLEDDRLFVFIAEIDEADSENPEFVSDDIYDEAAWYKSNPALRFGIVSLDYLRRQAQKAKANKSLEADFKRYHCNRRSSSKVRVFTAEQWAIGHNVAAQVDKSTPTILGLDIGWKDDLAGLAEIAVTGEIDVDYEEDGETKTEKRKTVRLDADIWIPENGPRDLTGNPWVNWIRSGLIRTCPGEEVRISYIKNRFDELMRTRNVIALYADRTSCREFLQWAEEEYGVRVVEFSQTCQSYNEPFREFITAVLDGRVAHNNPVLDWCAQNLIARKNAADYMMPSKRDSKDKIDPLQAGVMAFAGSMYEKIKFRPSVYKSRGFLMAGPDGVEVVR